MLDFSPDFLSVSACFGLSVYLYLSLWQAELERRGYGKAADKAMKERKGWHEVLGVSRANILTASPGSPGSPDRPCLPWQNTEENQYLEIYSPFVWWENCLASQMLHPSQLHCGHDFREYFNKQCCLSVPHATFLINHGKFHGNYCAVCRGYRHYWAAVGFLTCMCFEIHAYTPLCLYR